jgi:hypothetical protein
MIRVTIPCTAKREKKKHNISDLGDNGLKAESTRTEHRMKTERTKRKRSVGRRTPSRAEENTKTITGRPRQRDRNAERTGDLKPRPD